MDYVETASEAELRAIVLALCKDGRIERQVMNHIKKLRAADKNARKAGVKRKASSPFFICVRCGESFHEEANHSKACTYHHGKSASEARSKPRVLLTDAIRGHGNRLRRPHLG